MNNKDFISDLAARLGFSNKDTQSLINALTNDITAQLADGNTISVQNFGTFDVKKKMERIVVSPATGQRLLVPPKLVVNFKPAPLMKDKLKSQKL